MNTPSTMDKSQPWMWRFMPLLSSGTMRWLLVAGATWLATLIGIPEAIAPAQAERWAELALQVLQGVAIAWAGYHRYKNPTPPLVMTKEQAEQRNSRLASPSPTAEEKR